MREVFSADAMLASGSSVAEKPIATDKHAVLIVGGGPTGLMLAGELALADVDVAVVERRAGQDLVGPRARGLHARTIEELDQRGIADRFLAQGQTAQVAGFAWFPLDISDFPTRHNYGLALLQAHVERILAEWTGELAVPIYRGREVTGFVEDTDAIYADLSDGTRLQADYLVGCDGGKSLIRKAAGIAFPGWDATMSQLMAEVEMAAEPEWGLRRDALGIRALSRQDDGKVHVLVPERQPVCDTEPTLRDLREALAAVYGSDFGAHSPVWISRFTDMARQAACYRKGRVLIAGDAAHVHPPVGGQGLNIGMQDAMNLGWKLAQVVKQKAREHLLDTYHAERHPVAAKVLQNTMAQIALLRSDDRTNALRDFVGEFLKLEQPRKRTAAMMSGLDIRFDLGGGHPLLGRRMPDIDLVTAQGRCKVTTLLHDGRAVLLNLGEPGSLNIQPWADRVKTCDAEYSGVWELPVLGPVPAPQALLIRPDGYVAWIGDLAQVGLSDALITWFGPPAAP